MNRTTQGGRGPSGRRPSTDVRPSAQQPSEERYRRGARRTSAEPLAASWEPDPADAEEYRPRRRRTGVAGLVSNYGWRVYAIPVLLVLTMLVVLDSTVPNSFKIGAAGIGSGDGGSGATGGTGAEPRADQTSTEQTGPVVSETPPAKLDLNIPTAVLPDGPKYSENGAGTWQVIPGTTEPVGTGGKVYKYAIAIEDGVEPGDYGGDKDAFARTVVSFLEDPRSWVGTGEVGMQRVDGTTKADFTISLTSTNTTHQICGFQIQYESSCWDPNINRVIINTARWLRGAKAFSNDISSYRQYAINHEVGHALKHGHEACQENGAPAPVMMQQTFGVSNDYVAQLNEVDASNRGVVPADGKVCTTNAFPVAPK